VCFGSEEKKQFLSKIAKKIFLPPIKFWRIKTYKKFPGKNSETHTMQMSPQMQPLVMAFQEKMQSEQKSMEALKGEMEKLSGDLTKLVQQTNENELVKTVFLIFWRTGVT
jgi:hypothetical protein